MDILKILCEDRKTYIAAAQGEKLVDVARKRERREVTVDEMLTGLEQADPTGNRHKYLQWLVNMYIKGLFLLEDVARIRGELEEFERVKGKLEKKDISAYKTLTDLYAALEPFKEVDVTSNREADRKQEAELYEQGEAILLSSDPKVVEIHSERASKFFGRGTRWCTAADSNNMFDRYHQGGESPLYVVILDKEKYQLEFSTMQIMDASDTAVTEDVAKRLLGVRAIAGKLEGFVATKLAELPDQVIEVGEDMRHATELYGYDIYKTSPILLRLWTEVDRVVTDAIKKAALNATNRDIARVKPHCGIFAAFHERERYADQLDDVMAKIGWLDMAVEVAMAVGKQNRVLERRLLDRRDRNLIDLYRFWVRTDGWPEADVIE